METFQNNWAKREYYKFLVLGAVFKFLKIIFHNLRTWVHLET